MDIRSGPPRTFEDAATQRQNLTASNNAVNLALLVKHYVDFWRQFSHLPQDRSVEPAVSVQGGSGTAADPKIVRIHEELTDVHRVRNRTRDGMNFIDATCGGYVCAYHAPENRRRSAAVKGVAGPFPLVYVPAGGVGSRFNKTYAEWKTGTYGHGRAWVIDSAALDAQSCDFLRCGHNRVMWQLGASDQEAQFLDFHIEHGRMDNLPTSTTHRLAVYHDAVVTHYVVTFGASGPHEVEAREAGETAHVLGKAAVRRRY